MSADREAIRDGIDQTREIADRLLQFARVVRPECEFAVGWTMGEYLAGRGEDAASAADIAWLIEIFGDCINELAGALREQHLVKSDGQ